MWIIRVLRWLSEKWKFILWCVVPFRAMFCAWIARSKTSKVLKIEQKNVSKTELIRVCYSQQKCTAVWWCDQCAFQFLNNNNDTLAQALLFVVVFFLTLDFVAVVFYPGFFVVVNFQLQRLVTFALICIKAHTTWHIHIYSPHFPFSSTHF